MKIICKNISKSFNQNQVLKSINLELESGKFTTILGPSGCGKTTLLRILSGLEVPDEGEIYFDDLCVFSHEKGINLPAEKRNLGFVFQDFALWPHMTVFENVAFGLRVKKETNALNDKVLEALKAVRLEGFEKRFPHQCSGGQQQRIALARAIAISPECILFDEPLSALDALLREEMRNEIQMLTQAKQLTSIFVTHDQLEAMTLSDEIIVMNKGKIEMQGRPEEIYAHPTSTFVAQFIGKSNWLSSTSMIRPESCSLQPIEKAKQIDLIVRQCQFVGDGYQLLADYQNYEWTICTPHRKESKQSITVFIKEEEILNF